MSTDHGAEAGRITRVDGREGLVRLLEQMRPQRRVRLLAVPRAPVRRAKPLGDPCHGLEGGEVGEGIEWRDDDEARSGGLALGVREGARPLARGADDGHRMIGGVPRAQD